MLDLALDPHAAPAYVQIEEQIAERIVAGELHVGQRLPAERDLADALGVSRMTVRQALNALAARGLIERGVGRGTFVAPPKVDHDLAAVPSFTEQMARQGLWPGATVRAAVEQAAPLAVAAALDIEPGALVAHIQRVRFAGRVPLTLEDFWVPCERFPRLIEEDLTGSIYALMGSAYGLAPVRAVERLEPVLARPHEAELLRVDPGAALMLVERTAYAQDDIAVEFARDRHRGDRARFVIETRAHAGR